MRQSQIQALVLLAVVAIAGCAARGRAASPNAAKPKTAEPTKAAEAGSLQEYIAKVRHLSAVARPAAPTTSATTLESRVPELAEALLQVQAAPTADAHLAAGKLYRQRGVLDAAYRHYNAALKLQPDSAEAYEGLARVWRDWRLPELAVGDAARARFYAPDSPEIENTFGTIMQALGRNGDARRAYERAKRLDARATYALNNLCYLAFLEGRMEAAVDLCRAAVKLDPGLKTAHHNLALAYAASGEMALANAAFADAGDAAEASFNLGIVYMAGRNYRDAAAAFDAASRARPTLNIARERASEARSLARTAPQPVPSTPDVGDTK